MATVTRAANIRALNRVPYCPWLYVCDPRNTVLLTTPIPTLPPRFYDTTQWRPVPKWNSAVYFDPPNVTVTLPNPNPSVPTRAPDFGLSPPVRRNSAVYFDSPDGPLAIQMGFIGRPVRSDRFDLTQRLYARPVLNVEYPPNLSLSLLSSNPYVPVDVSAPVLPPRRNAALLFEAQNLVGRPPGLRPIIPLDWNMRPAVRQPITFDAPNLALRLPTGARPIIPADISLPVRSASRCGSLYEAQGSLLTTSLFLPAVLTPGSDVDFNYDSVVLRYKARQLLAATTWIEPQRALLAPPVVTATIPNLSYNASTGIQTYAAGTAFSGATSYAIAPATDAGITFNTVTGLITTDTGVASVASHGPYTITATNSNGSIASNAFTISVTAGNYHVDGPRVTCSTTSLGATYTVSGPHVVRDVPESEDLS